MCCISLCTVFARSHIGTCVTALSVLRCTGRETLLSSCPSRGGVAAELCGHHRDAGVECNVPPAQCWERYVSLLMRM